MQTPEVLAVMASVQTRPEMATRFYWSAQCTRVELRVCAVNCSWVAKAHDGVFMEEWDSAALCGLGPLAIGKV